MILESDVFLVTKDNYPKTFEALEIISHDIGNQAGHTNYTLPLEFEEKILKTESTLKELNKKEFDDFCIGEESDKERVLNNHPYLTYFDTLLGEIL